MRMNTDGCWCRPRGKHVTRQSSAPVDFPFFDFIVFAMLPGCRAVLDAKALFGLAQVEMILQVGATLNELYDIVLPLTDAPASILNNMLRAQGTKKDTERADDRACSRLATGSDLL